LVKASRKDGKKNHYLADKELLDRIREKKKCQGGAVFVSRGGKKFKTGSKKLGRYGCKDQFKKKTIIEKIQTITDMWKGRREEACKSEAMGWERELG